MSVLSQQSFLNQSRCWGFPAGPVVRTLPSIAGGVGSIPVWGTKIPHASQTKVKNVRTLKMVYIGGGELF